MELFSKRKELAVQSFVLKLVNNHSPALRAQLDGPRLDSRVNLAVVVLIVPIEGRRLQVSEAFMAVTTDFSNTGVAVVLDQSRRLDRAVLGFHFAGTMTFVRAKEKHITPMGGGFYQLGFQLTEIVSAAEHPELQPLSL